VKYSLNAAMWFGGMDLTKLVWKLNGTTDQPAGLIHSQDTKRYAVTFLDNHDTYRNNDKFTGNVLAAYAFLMGSPGVPCVFLPHWNANKTTISAMIAARRSVQLHSESAVTVNQSSSNIYVATATGLSGTLIVKIGSGSYTPPSDYTLATSGTDYAIWTKVSTMAPFLSVSPTGGTYYSPQTVTMSTSTGADIYYTANNTTPTSASTLYTTPLDVSGNTTLRAVAYNPTTQLYSDEAVNTYTIFSFPISLTVRFKVPAGWTACNVYSWTSGGTLTAGWPGNAMTLESDGTYSYSVTGFTTLPIGIVFNNGAGSSQTVDLFASGNICWEAAGLSDGKYLATEVICLGTGVKKLAENTFGIYPNPSHGQLTINAPQKGQLTVYTLQGKMLLQKNLEKATENLDLSEFGKGIYLLSFEGKEGRSFRKIVVE
jgi:alpha-amylase